MAKFNFVEHLLNISNNLMSRYKLAEAYQHKGGKGHIRETVLIDWLKELLPDTVSISKGEIVDSNCQQSCEFDIVIYLKSPMPKLFSSQEKKVIPVETVLAVIEVKSQLKKDDIDVFAESISNINQFSRYFKPTELNLRISKLTGTEPFPESPILAGDIYRKAEKIIGGIFAFEAATPETVQKYFETVKTPDNFAWTFVLESCFWLNEKNNWVAYKESKSSILFFVKVLLKLCEDSQRFTHIEPNFDRYILNAIPSEETLKKQ